MAFLFMCVGVISGSTEVYNPRRDRCLTSVPSSRSGPLTLSSLSGPQTLSTDSHKGSCVRTLANAPLEEEIALQPLYLVLTEDR